ncbi:hypothetical protein B0I35DRAFT_236211 [Stachybotrys elegans]|uniref:Uncharacterized protein n=1 Tax=Stachybotrys elegans TaxID=80388 RepID=A0A8K0WQA5_9HYPO|nr:hypothetical protein B0I35DRAFT_236211 [Stachybotrys elegans]
MLLSTCLVCMEYRVGYNGRKTMKTFLNKAPAQPSQSISKKKQRRLAGDHRKLPRGRQLRIRIQSQECADGQCRSQNETAPRRKKRPDAEINDGSRSSPNERCESKDPAGRLSVSHGGGRTVARRTFVTIWREKGKRKRKREWEKKLSL